MQLARGSVSEQVNAGHTIGATRPTVSSMAPKVNPAEVQARAAVFESIGLSSGKAVEVAKNAKLATALEAFLRRQQVTSAVPAKQANLLLHLVSADAELDAQRQAIVTQAILEDKLATPDQVSGMPQCLYYAMAQASSSCRVLRQGERVISAS
jgi:hypothetical protein